MENANKSKTFCCWSLAHEFRTRRLALLLYIPCTLARLLRILSHEEWEDRVETSILWMTAIFLEILGAYRVLSYKPEYRHKYFSLPFQMKQMQQIREFCTAERESYSTLWLIYSPHLVKMKNGGTGMKSQAERGQQNNILRAGLHAKIQQQTDLQDFLSSWSSIAFVNSVGIIGGHSIFWNSLGTLNTLKLPWHVFLPVLFLSGFYSSIDFNGLHLRSLVSESLELYLYRAQTARSLV